MACMEAAAYVAQCDGGAPSKLLGAGVLEVPSAAGAAEEPAAEEPAAEAAALAPLPFVVVQKAEGVTLGSCMERLSEPQWLAVAAAAGRSLAAFHRMPLPAAASSSSVCTAWIARDGIIYSSAAGTLDVREEEVGSPATVLRNQRQALWQLLPTAAALLGRTAAKGGHATEAVADGSGDGSGPACRAWAAFLAFLRRQRKHAAKMHRREGSLPPQLQEQVESFLPADPAVLVGHGAGGCSSCCSVTGMPCWVHGDLTAENILLGSALVQPLEGTVGQEAQPDDGSGSSDALLIDFADSGHGDPLWDFVPLFLRSFRQDGSGACLVALRGARASVGCPCWDLCVKRTALHPACRSNLAAADACLAVYCAALSPPPPTAPAASPAAAPRRVPVCWPARPPGMSLSYVALCYSLLHELGPMHDVFKRRPGLWEAGSLREVQHEVFGWLDAL